MACHDFQEVDYSASKYHHHYLLFFLLPHISSKLKEGLIRKIKKLSFMKNIVTYLLLTCKHDRSDYPDVSFCHSTALVLEHFPHAAYHSVGYFCFCYFFWVFLAEYITPNFF